MNFPHKTKKSADREATLAGTAKMRGELRGFRVLSRR